MNGTEVRSLMPQHWYLPVLRSIYEGSQTQVWLPFMVTGVSHSLGQVNVHHIPFVASIFLHDFVAGSNTVPTSHQQFSLVCAPQSIVTG